ncbi:MAG: efflux RND transporter periplasmic adaptor subunit [Gammaproteobacteria bacterium]
MSPMIITVWLSQLLGSVSVYGIGPPAAGHMTLDHDSESAAYATVGTAPAAGEPCQEERGCEPHRHEQADRHGTQQPGGQDAEEQAHDDKERERDGHGHDHANEHRHLEEEPGTVQLTVQQRRTVAIRTERIEPRTLGETLRAPGEVRLNAYASAQIAPRIVAQVTGRHARLGEQVETGQPMVTLSSVEMAQAQGNLVVAERAWQRVRQLGRKVVSESRYLETQIGRQQARARVVAFGMTSGQVDALLRSGATKADGTFALLAPQAGTVIADQFMLGEVVEAGQTLFEITDESVRWVEAQMAPEDAARVSVGDSARVSTGKAWLDGRVTQIHHQLDETTRTQAIRVEVPDPDHQLHPGIFVDVEVYAAQGTPVLALPEAALLRGADGDWQVFVAGNEVGSYQAVQVRLVRTTGGLAVIAGLAPGSEVVTHGAFFLQSELAKGGFDIHQH